VLLAGRQSAKDEQFERALKNLCLLVLGSHNAFMGVSPKAFMGVNGNARLTVDRRAESSKSPYAIAGVATSDTFALRSRRHSGRTAEPKEDTSPTRTFAGVCD